MQGIEMNHNYCLKHGAYEDQEGKMRGCVVFYTTPHCPLCSALTALDRASRGPYDDNPEQRFAHERHEMGG